MIRFITLLEHDYNKTNTGFLRTGSSKWLDKNIDKALKSKAKAELKKHHKKASTSPKVWLSGGE